MVSDSQRRKGRAIGAWLIWPLGVLAVIVIIVNTELVLAQGFRDATKLYLMDLPGIDFIKCLTGPVVLMGIAFSIVRLGAGRVPATFEPRDLSPVVFALAVIILSALVAIAAILLLVFNMMIAVVLPTEDHATKRVGANVVPLEMVGDDTNSQDFYLLVCDETGRRCRWGLVCYSPSRSDNRKGGLVIDDVQSVITVTVDGQAVYRQDAVRGVFFDVGYTCSFPRESEREPIRYPP